MSDHVSPADYCSSSVVPFVLVRVLDLEFALRFKLVLLMVLLLVLLVILFLGTAGICASVQVLCFRLFFDMALLLFLDVHAPVLVPGHGSCLCL